jgi:hypothetical protein
MVEDDTDEAVVLEILSEAYFSVNRWWVKVLAKLDNSATMHVDLVFNTFEEANQVVVGYKFLT